jgi:hypothetical protein
VVLCIVGGIFRHRPGTRHFLAGARDQTLAHGHLDGSHRRGGRGFGHGGHCVWFLSRLEGLAPGPDRGAPLRMIPRMKIHCLAALPFPRALARRLHGGAGFQAPARKSAGELDRPDQCQYEYKRGNTRQFFPGGTGQAWWNKFNDSTLVWLIDEALRTNLDLQLAEAACCARPALPAASWPARSMALSQCQRRLHAARMGSGRPAPTHFFSRRPGRGVGAGFLGRHPAQH